nr:hypothetical protein Itr_chr11CG07580 [Ipomoea trifida]
MASPDLPFPGERQSTPATARTVHFDGRGKTVRASLLWFRRRKAATTGLESLRCSNQKDRPWPLHEQQQVENRRWRAQQQVETWAWTHDAYGSHYDPSAQPPWVTGPPSRQRQSHHPRALHHRPNEAAPPPRQ